MQIETGILAVFISILVFRFNVKKDKESLREKAWTSQQQLNLAVLANPQNLLATELTIEGLNSTAETDSVQRAVYVTFIQLNRLNLFWRAWKSGVFTEEEAREEIQPTLRLIIGSEEMLNYCLSRGYPPAFVEYIQREARSVRNEIRKPNTLQSFIQSVQQP